MKIKIKKITKKVAKNNNDYWVVEDFEGEKYTTFDKVVGEGLKEGKEYDVGITEKNGFKNISSANLGIIAMPEAPEEPKPQAQTQAPSFQTKEEYWAKRNKEIRRMAVIKVATDLVIKNAGEGKATLTDVIKLAEKIEKWVVA